MKRVMVLSLAAILSVAGVLSAADEQEKNVIKSAAAQRVLDEKKAGLNNTEWTIELKPMGGGPKTRVEKDTLHFSDGTVSSANFGKSGYGPSNFTARMLEEETFTWETMQTSQKEGIIFWRGDIGPDGIMRGVLSKRDLKNNTKDFNFVSTGSQKVAPPDLPAAEPAAAEGK